ncbi:hypothetical protein AX17_006637 [Amanita inopinata Kibby_2008]|nr:hypothetical protein AX17_006637 [Amanita inopinata Kibby_2008]
MSHPASPQTLEALNDFSFRKVINEDPVTRSLTLLGTFPSPTNSESQVQAIIRVERTALDVSNAPLFFAPENKGLVQRVHLEESTDIVHIVLSLVLFLYSLYHYTWLFGWLGENRERDLKINVICPATDVHVRKYSRQELVMVHETPELYNEVVKHYIAAFPPSRTQWVENILNGLSEQNKILYSSPDFVILPDMKWDLTTLSSLYLVAIVRNREIRSLRDLRRSHVAMLQAIRYEAARIVREKYGLAEGSLGMYVHYQPSYYHFHVHIVNVNQTGLMSMTVGQAHLLDDVISMIQLDPEEGPGIFQRMMLTYALGDQHGLYEAIRKASTRAAAS